MGGTIMFASGTGGSGNAGGSGRGPSDDDDFDVTDEYGAPEAAPEPRQRPPRVTRGGDANGRRRTVQFEPEERYWTDYLRIALPVIGLLLMIGLLWFWAQQIISDEPDTTEPSPTEEIGLVTTITPEPTEETAASTPPAQTSQVSGTNQQGQQADAAETPQTNQQTAGGDNQSNAVDSADTTDTAETTQPTATAAAGGDIAVDSTVTVTEALNMRDAPSTTGNLVVELPVGSTLTVIGGPETGEDYTWWNVVDESGNSGWVVEDFIQLAG